MFYCLYMRTYIYTNIKKARILRHVSLEANRYQLASTEGVASDVTATILLPLFQRTLPSDKQKLHGVFGWAVFQIFVWTQLVITEVFHASLQALQSYAQQ